jgi:transcriptional regulator with XRE-family HTH domain
MASMLRPQPSLGTALKRWRALNRVKQTHAAELFGVAQSTVSRWEAGTQEMDPVQRARVENVVHAKLSSSGDIALRRLVEGSGSGSHLICDSTHRLLAISSSRRREFGPSADDLLGRPLWHFMTEELARSEQALGSVGWYDLASPPSIVSETGSNDSDIVPIKPGRCRWTRLILCEGAAVRLIETIC